VTERRQAESNRWCKDVANDTSQPASDEVVDTAPSPADKVALRTAGYTITQIAREVDSVVGHDGAEDVDFDRVETTAGNT